jgi:hypothetical protein
MRLAERIEEAGLSPEVLAAFRLGLAEVATVRGYASMENALLSRLFDRLVPPETDAADFEDLWPHAELFLTAALTIALADGEYGVEEARAIGSLAMRLGYSASMLANIEDRVLGELKARGRTFRAP